MSISKALRARVEAAFNHQCCYCRMPKHLIYGQLEVDHIFPKDKGGTDDEPNLCAACRNCNGHKAKRSHILDPRTGTMIALFNPRQQLWSEHFMWDNEDRAVIVGLTECGKITVAALKMNDDDRLSFRRLMTTLGWYPPTE